jgi:transcriptional regulator with XRE-family HTH domain
MSITTAQIRGARGILNWSQQDLAQRTGISATSIGAIENGQTTPRESTLATIRKTLEKNGIEFVGRQGVRERDNALVNYEGRQGIQDFFDDVYETIKEKGGEICLFNGVPSKLIEWLGDEFYQMHIKRMNGMKDKFSFNIIIAEGDTQFIASGFAKYKWFPKDKFNDRTIYCYGDKLAFLNFTKDNVRILVMEQPDISESFKALFNIAWLFVAIEPELKKNA